MKDFAQLVHSLILVPPLSQRDRSAIRSSQEPWGMLALELERAQNGDFSGFAEIADLMRRDRTALYWSASATITGLAAPSSALRRIVDDLLDERHRYGVQYYVASMLAYSCLPWAVGPLLALYEAGEDDEIRDHVLRSLSMLLEAEFGPVFAGPEFHDKYPDDNEDDEVDYSRICPEELLARVPDMAGYRDRLAGILTEIRARGVAARTALFEGALLDAGDVTHRLLRRLTDAGEDSSRVFEGARLVSAMVGADYGAMRNRETGRLDRLATAALLEEVLEALAERDFTPGQRYFFGHPIPD